MMSPLVFTILCILQIITITVFAAVVIALTEGVVFAFLIFVMSVLICARLWKTRGHPL
jgi:hypothetical protein